MTEETVATWFGLSRPNFILDPISDAGFYAPRTRININSIIEGLEVDLVTQLPPKRLFWGLYGGGKTHTLMRIARGLEELIPVCPVYVECPNVPKRSTFIHLYHDGIMAAIGREFVVKLFEDLIHKMGLMRREELQNKLSKELQDEELSRAIAALLGATDERRLTFWRYISGVSVPQRDLTELGQTQDLTQTEPARLAGIIVTVGRIVKQVKAQTLVLILDELDRLKAVTDEFAGSTFENAFRKLMDPNQRDIAVLMACSTDSLRELPDVFGGERGPVLTRIGPGLFEIPEIDSGTEVDTFIGAILDFIRDKKFDVAQRIAKLDLPKGETAEPALYPFTTKAMEALKGELKGIMTPREITQRMTLAAGKAFKTKRPIITADIVSARGVSK